MKGMSQLLFVGLTMDRNDLSDRLNPYWLDSSSQLRSNQSSLSQAPPVQYAVECAMLFGPTRARRTILISLWHLGQKNAKYSVVIPRYSLSKLIGKGSAIFKLPRWFLPLFSCRSTFPLYLFYPLPSMGLILRINHLNKRLVF